jgi:purine nucleosidase
VAPHQAPSQATKRLVLVDTDVSLGTPGAEIDDGAALIALLRSTGLAVQGITTVHGNVPVELATHNLRRLLSFLGRDEIPVGLGAVLPLLEDPSWFAPWQTRYGPTLPWPDQPPLPAGANLLVNLIRANPGQITILALGPLTNLALALRLAPDIAGKVQEVVAMGGSFDSHEPAAEFNVRCDPEAAHIVFTAAWPLRLLGLDVTRQVLFSREDFRRLPDANPALRLLKSQAPGWIDVVEEQGWESGGCALHDAVAVAALLDESLFGYVEATVEVELAEPSKRGLVTFRQQKGRPQGEASQSHGGTTRVAVSLDVSRCHALIWSHLTR